jgi:hypothetical protein
MSPRLSSEPTLLTLENDPLRILIYGEFGRRKTTLAGTFPRPLFIDTNGGLVSIALQGRAAERFEPTGHEDLEALYWWIKEHIDNYDTIVIDTVDNLVLQLMGEISDDAVSFKERDGKKVSLRMRFVPEQGDYYANQQQMFRFLVALRRLGKHIVLVSSHRIKNGRTAPNVSDGMEKVLCDFVSVVGEMVLWDEPDQDDLEALPELYDGAGVIITQESNSRATKSRYRSLKPGVVDPTFEKLYGLIEAEIAASAETKQAAQRRTSGRK